MNTIYSDKNDEISDTNDEIKVSFLDHKYRRRLEGISVAATEIAEIISSDKDVSKKSKNSRSAIIPAADIKANKASGLIHFDIDVKDNIGVDFVVLRDELIKLTHMYYVFWSPRSGLKFAIKTDFCLEEYETLELNRYKVAYDIVLEYVVENIKTKFVDDKAVRFLKSLCYLNYDETIFFNKDCPELTVNAQCKLDLILKPAPLGARLSKKSSYQVKSKIKNKSKTIKMLLGYIPRDFKYNQRFFVNLSVLSSLGESGVALLLAHWSTPNITKLETDLQVQLKYTQENDEYKSESLGYLFKIADYNQTTGAARKHLLPIKQNYQFKPLLTPLEAEIKIAHTTDRFFSSDKSIFLNSSMGVGKTFIVLKQLEQLPATTNILYLVRTHELAAEIVEKFGDIRTVNTRDNFKDKATTKSNIIHIKGRNKLCISDVVKERYKVGQSNEISIPMKQCKKDCPIAGICPATTQYNNILNNIRVSTFNDYFNKISAFANGSSENESDENIDMIFSKIKWDPDYIIIDENIIEEKTETLSRGKFPIIDKVIDQLIDTDIETVLKEHENEIIAANQVNKKRLPEFENYEQYIKAINETSSYSIVLEHLAKYCSSKKETKLNGIRCENEKIIMSSIKTKDTRYKDIPTFFLDATAEQDIVNFLLPDVEFVDVKVKQNDNINLYQLANTVMTKASLEEECYLNNIINGLNKLITSKGYTNVGLITYKKLNNNDDFVGYVSEKIKAKVSAHFGNTRGLNKFENVDCLLVLGRYSLASVAENNLSWAINKAMSPLIVENFPRRH